MENSAQEFEAFYNIAVTPAFRLTLDLQVLEPVESTVNTVTILGLRASLNF